MSDMPGSLFEALARFQENLPEVAASRTGHVDPRDQTKQGYDFGYADLDDVSRAALPKLAALGLAWITKPGVQDGKFGLYFALVHWQSGEREDGFYELQMVADLQQRGKLLSYARRQALCAVTGIAPRRDEQARSGRRGGAGQQPSAGTEWERASRERPQAVPPRDSSPAPADRRAWLAGALKQADAFNTRAAGDTLWRETAEKKNDGEITPAEAKQVFDKIIACWQALGDAEARGHLGHLTEDDQWRDDVMRLADLAHARMSLNDVGDMARSGRMDTNRAMWISKAIIARFPKAARAEDEAA